jgi:hypothetical protein
MVKKSTVSKGNQATAQAAQEAVTTGESAPTIEQEVASIRARNHGRDLAEAAARNDLALRTAMIDLVADFGLLVRKSAIGLATIKSIDDGEAANLLVWQMAEFLSSLRLERDEPESPICQAFELDKAHAGRWFSIGESLESKS